jgi:DNA-binding ferritin-like protein
MKKFLLFLGLAPAAFGQLVVYDPANHIVDLALQADQQANHAEILRQWAADLDQLNEQLRQLQAQLTETRSIRQTLGDPAAAGDKVGLTELNNLDRSFGETVAALRALANSAESLLNTAHGVFLALDDRTVLNQPFARQSAPYQRYAVVDKHADNLDTVFAQTAERLAALQRDLGDTLQLLKTAGTQAEVEKYSAKIAALNGQIAATAAQRRDVFEQLQAQQTLNDNQAAKERQDLLEKQIAEERQTFAVVGTWQQGLKLTATSYTNP